MKRKSNVTVFLEVYNEEHRIEDCIKCFLWADQIVVIDKSSTDNTRDIASQYATEVITIPYSENSDAAIDIISAYDSSEWVMFPTASSLMHPNLAEQIIRLTTDKSLTYDAIAVPFSIYVLGILNKHSPWYGKRKKILIRKNSLKLSKKIHNEFGHYGGNVYEMPLLNDDEVLYHCTHNDIHDFHLRHIRYTRRESLAYQGYTYKKAMRLAFFSIIKAVYHVTIRRRSFMMGWNGIALSLAYVSYFVMQFLYVWDIFHPNGNVIYPTIRRKIVAMAEERSGHAT